MSLLKAFLGYVDVDLTVGGDSVFDLVENQFARTLKIECYRRRSNTTIVIFDVKAKWYIGTDSLISEVHPTKEAPLSSPESDPEDPKAIKHVQLFGGRVLAVFSGYVSHARKSIKLLKDLIGGDEEPPTVAMMAEMLGNKLKELHIRRGCDIVLIDNRRRVVDGDGIAYVDVDYEEIKISIPDINQPIAFGTGKTCALTFLNGRLPANFVEAKLLIRGAIQAAYLGDESTGGNIVLIVGSGNNRWEQENLARLGSNPITIKDEDRIQKRQKRVRDQLKMDTSNAETENVI